MRQRGLLVACTVGVGLSLVTLGCRRSPPGPGVVAPDAAPGVADPAPTLDAEAPRSAPVDRARLEALRHAVAFANVETTRRLLEAGTDPNALLGDGSSVAKWLAAGQHIDDDDALAVATLLAEHGCTFQAGLRASGLLSNLAYRHLPKTLRFVASRIGAQGCSGGLKAMARQGGDFESAQVLLECGADPLWGTTALESALLDAASEGRTHLVVQMLGFTLAVAVFNDATVVRMVVGPALLQLAGDWNWWPLGLYGAPASEKELIP